MLDNVSFKLVAVKELNESVMMKPQHRILKVFEGLGAVHHHWYILPSHPLLCPTLEENVAFSSLHISEYIFWAILKRGNIRISWLHSESI